METERIAREINSAFVAYKLGNDMEYIEDMNSNFFKYCEKMYEMHNEHLYKLTREVLLDSNENIKTFFKDILTEMFSDNIINWGRIIMVFVFGARLAVLCKDRNRTDLIDQVIQNIDKYVKTEFLEWINIQGGWNNFDQSYTQHKTIAEIPLMNVSSGIALSLIATLYLYNTFC
ncbi:apoptosis regulator BAX-like [Anneissia japonica]|uniref:apoptosis regulator BAX-like n=1 Tax=Anneissia japonica TaxID=1529436 RepID=UPI0014258EDE|nr:apoptosis regulator BAX-like [Anneissia japonica]